jgi:predicted acetyltransferase
MAGIRSDTSAPVLVRPAHRDDLDRLLEIHVAAFPDPRPIEVRRRVFLHNRLGGLEHLRVAHAGSELLGHAFSFPIGVWFGGREVPGRAIASVGVAVESRGRGVARALLEAIHAEARDRGDAFALLYPFRQGFYARHGYTPMAKHRVLTVSPRAIPASWRDAAPGVVRRAVAADRAEINRVYREAAARGTGFLARAERAWEHDLLEERHHWLVLEQPGGSLAGYASVRLLQVEPHARVRADVREVVSPDDAARRRLFAALAALGDQVGDMTFALGDDDPLDWAFVDGDRDRGGTKDVEHAQGVVNTGPMLRLVSPEAALEARGYLEDGTLELVVDNGAPLELEVSNGAAQVRPSAGQAATGALRLSSQGLAATAFGGLSVLAAARLGWASSSDPVTLARATALFRMPAFFTLDAF